MTTGYWRPITKPNPTSIKVDGIMWELQGYGFDLIPAVHYRAVLGKIGKWTITSWIDVEYHQPCNFTVWLERGERQWRDLFRAQDRFSGYSFDEVARLIAGHLKEHRDEYEKKYGVAV